MTHQAHQEHVSGYVQYLPAPLQNGRFVGRFLLAFEAVLSGIEQADHSTHPRTPRGLGQVLDTITRHFQPREAPADFLPWLAEWVALELRADWSLATRREVLAAIVPLYTLRGTRRGIEQAVRLCVEETADVRVDDSESATHPHYFQVTLTVAARQTPDTIRAICRKAEAAIDLQKPAHTYYRLQLQYPALELLDAPDPALGTAPTVPQMKQADAGVYVGMNTVLGSGVGIDLETGEKRRQPTSPSGDQ